MATSSAETHFDIVVIGTGFGGLGMGVALKKANKNFVILEKSSNVGGVWRDNTYPGCTCDVPSHLYSFSFAPYRRRDTRYPSQQDILAYLEQVVDDYALRSHIRLGSEVSLASFQESKNLWEITTPKEIYYAETVVFAAGQLHQPNMPDMFSRFDGPVFHTAQWQKDVELDGKSVAIIGTGSSAVQMLPKVAAVASSVTVYQRTPQWILPKPDMYFGVVSRLLLRIPGAHAVYREALSRGADSILSPIPRSRIWREFIEKLARCNLRSHVSDANLIQKLTPTYPLGAKRILLDNHYYTALGQENVHLVTDPIATVTSSCILTNSGASVTPDIIICATGFKASEFLQPVSIVGRGRRMLSQEWSDGAEAFLGLAIHGYPNLFMIAGPNTFNPAGSNPQMKELQIDYIMRCLRWKESKNARIIEVSEQSMASYQQGMERRIRSTVWPESVKSWYKHESGKVTNPWPASMRKFARLLSEKPSSAFVVDVPEDDRDQEQLGRS